MPKAMSGLAGITLREVESSDLEIFYEHQLDPEANRMAAFVGKNPKDKLAFHAHWDKILHSPQITQRTIVAEGRVVGHIACYPDEGNLEVTFWLGREFWGEGLATQALERMLQIVTDRPILARAATDNIGSIRVLQKCGFKITGKNKDFAHGRGEEIEEYILRLDVGEASSRSTPDQPAAQDLERLRTAYAAFNARDIDAALAIMTADVAWPRAFKGGFVEGPEAVRAYWTEQWSEISPQVTPVAFHLEADGRILVEVQQVVRDLAGAVLAEERVGHRFTLTQGLIRKMEVGPAA